jgi:hypothetical protein
MIGPAYPIHKGKAFLREVRMRGAYIPTTGYSFHPEKSRLHLVKIDQGSAGLRFPLKLKNVMESGIGDQAPAPNLFLDCQPDQGRI